MRNMKTIFSDKLSNSRRYQVGFFIVVMSVIVVSYVFLSKYVQVKNAEKKVKEMQVSIDYDTWYDLLDTDIENEMLKFSGWVIKKDRYVSGIRMVLNEEDTAISKIYLAETGVNEEMEQFFNVDWENGWSSFWADIPLEALESNAVYKIQLAIYYNDQGITEAEEKCVKIDTGKYLYNNELYLYNPIEFEKIDIKDNELAFVISEGDLLLFDKEYSFWVYRYKQNIYHIINSDFGSLKLAGIGLPILPRTNCIELLPQERIQYECDHLGFYYEDEEYNRKDVAPYQVIKVELSDKYPITYFETGLYDAKGESWIRRYVIPLMDAGKKKSEEKGENQSKWID